MKKKIINVLLVSSIVFAGILSANIETHKCSLEDTVKGENVRCAQCGGSGFSGNFNCFYCKGTGRYGSY